MTSMNEKDYQVLLLLRDPVGGVLMVHRGGGVIGISVSDAETEPAVIALSDAHRAELIAALQATLPETNPALLAEQEN